MKEWSTVRFERQVLTVSLVYKYCYVIGSRILGSEEGPRALASVVGAINSGIRHTFILCQPLFF